MPAAFSSCYAGKIIEEFALCGTRFYFSGQNKKKNHKKNQGRKKKNILHDVHYPKVPWGGV